jgi:hypothetical protein
MMDQKLGRGQTTKGVWLEVARNTNNLAVMDLEGIAVVYSQQLVESIVAIMVSFHCFLFLFFAFAFVLFLFLFFLLLLLVLCV